MSSQRLVAPSKKGDDRTHARVNGAVDVSEADGRTIGPMDTLGDFWASFGRFRRSMERARVTPWHVERFAPERAVASKNRPRSARDVRFVFVRVTRRSRSGARLSVFESAR